MAPLTSPADEPPPLSTAAAPPIAAKKVGKMVPPPWRGTADDPPPLSTPAAPPTTAKKEGQPTSLAAPPLDPPHQPFVGGIVYGPGGEGPGRKAGLDSSEGDDAGAAWCKPQSGQGQALFDPPTPDMFTYFEFPEGDKQFVFKAGSQAWRTYGRGAMKGFGRCTSFHTNKAGEPAWILQQDLDPTTKRQKDGYHFNHNCIQHALGMEWHDARNFACAGGSPGACFLLPMSAGWSAAQPTTARGWIWIT